MAWVIVGLGNPGEEYKNTRHNAGRMALEFFSIVADFTPLKEDPKNKVHVSKGAIKKNLAVLLAPDTYMNKSGTAVMKYVKECEGCRANGGGV
jgi:peptidyl-tRNA hydrolase, PTH1 family